MKIAIVLTVKNEERILRNNLLYHKAIGVDKAFVYFDNTSDKGKESIADLDFVSNSNSVNADNYTHLEYLDKFTSQAIEHHTARQCLNTFDAHQQCKAEGIDWLISLDADELICTDFQNPSNLKSFFNEIPSEVEVVYFKTLEAVQHKMQYQNVFAEETLFKANRNAYFKTFYNPFAQSKQRFSWWYGQTLGKGAIRPDRNLIPHNVHRFRNLNGSKPTALKKDAILHYHVYDAEDFIKKFKNFSDRPNTFLSGNKVEDIKLLLRDIVNTSGLDKKQLEHYFKDNLLFNEKEMNKMKKGRKNFLFKFNPAPIQEVNSVMRTFKNLQHTN